jgi:lysyl-tRNA synthetase, class I
VLLRPEAATLSEDALANAIYEVMKAHALDAKRFFPEIYRVLIGKTNGPKLAAFVQAIGVQRAAALLKQAL